MKRRTAIRNIIFFSLGTGIIYSCKDKYEAIKMLDLKYLHLETNHLDLLDELSNLIVPLQGIPELENHTALPFIINSVDKLYDADDRQLFVDGYTSWDAEIAMLKGKKFSKMELEEKQDLIEELNEEKVVASPALYKVFNILKSSGIRYLSNTEYYQRSVNYYEMAPGRFRGDVLLSELKNMNDE